MTTTLGQKGKEYQKKFISLLLKHSDLVSDWIESNLDVSNFDSDFRLMIEAIVSAHEHKALLTRDSFVHFVNKFKTKKEAIAQEMLYNQIYFLDVDRNDFVVLKDSIVDNYILSETVNHIHEFTRSRDKKGNKVALCGLVDSLGTLVHGYGSVTKTIYEDVNEYSPEYLKWLEGIRNGSIIEEEKIICGIKEIDYAISVGIQPGTLTLFCADVSGFKTTIMLNIGFNVWWEYKKNVLFVPIEMPRNQLYIKMLSRYSGIPYEYLNTPKSLNEEQVNKVKHILSEEWPGHESKFFMMDCEDRIPVSLIKAQIEKNIDIFKPDMVIIDYIANLIPDKIRRERNDLEIGDMLKDLRHMGRTKGFSVISAAQMGRDALKRQRRTAADKFTVHSEDIRASHEYAADADNIFFLIPDPSTPTEKLQIYIVKARLGKKVFAGNKLKAVLEVKPEISLIQSMQDCTVSENPDIMQVFDKADCELDFNDDVQNEVTTKIIEDNIFAE